MKQLNIILCAALLFSSCAMDTRILKKTANSATIQFDTSKQVGKLQPGFTKQDAIAGAEEKATELFGEFVHEKDTDCSQEYAARVDKDGGSGKTYWICIILVRKK